MKKSFLPFLAVIILLFFSGCAQPLTIAAGSSQEEDSIYALTDMCLPYNYSGASDYWITAWMKRYQYGNLTESKPDLLTCSCTEKGRIIFYSDLSGSSDEFETLNAAILQNGAVQSFVPEVVKLNAWDSFDFVHITQGEGKEIEAGKTVLACIECNQDPRQEIPDEFFTDYENHLDAIATMPDVILLGCEFTTEEPDIAG